MVYGVDEPIMGKPPNAPGCIPFCMASIICIWLKSPAPANPMLGKAPFAASKAKFPPAPIWVFESSAAASFSASPAPSPASWAGSLVSSSLTSVTSLSAVLCSFSSAAAAS